MGTHESDAALIAELRRQLDEANEALRETKARFRKKLELAAKIHHSMVPSPVRHERIDIDVHYLPIEEVGGDYCQVRFPGDDLCYITMCDVTGHGIGPSLLATRVSSEVRSYIASRSEPQSIVQRLNAFIYENFQGTRMFPSFIAARIDLAKSEITWSGAGHPPVLLIRHGNGGVELLPSQNLLIGVMQHSLSAEPQHTAPLSEGDRLLFYTDGLTEETNPAGEQFGEERLIASASRAMSQDLFNMAGQMLEEIATHRAGPISDDMTLIVAGVK